MKNKPEAVSSANARQDDYPNQTYAWYVVGVLTVAYIFSFIDRQIINLLVEPIREDLQLTDTQISLVQGIAFALFYTLMGIPIARLADVSNRRAIIAAGVFLWSLMTVMCGLAKSFGQLFAARIGMGIGQAALSPPAFSLFADYFPPGKVTRAIAVFSGGSFLGAGLAYIIGGYVIDLVTRLDVVDIPVFGQIRAWQMAFIAVGLPGILLALLVLSLREPARRGLLGDEPGAVPKGIPIREIIAFLRKNRRAYGHHFIGASMFVMLAHAILSWAPAFFIRKYGWTPGEVGLIYGSTLLIFGTSGVVGAGWIADALRRRGYTDANLRVIMIGALCCTPFGAAAFLVDNIWLAVALMAPFTFLWALPHGISPAAIQLVTPNQMRAQVTALYFLTVNLIGLGIGPTFVALLTDYLYGDPALVGHSLATVVAISAPLSALILYPGLKYYRASLVEAEQGWQKL